MIENARRVVPDLAIRTTFIVGFPGEGEPELEELIAFIREVRFDHLGVFMYSWQEENPGSHLGDPIPEKEKQERRSRVLEIQQAVSLELNRRLEGRVLPAVVSGPLAEMELLTEGRLKRQAPEIDGRLLINDGVAEPGSLIDAEITEAHPYDLVGRVVRVVKRPAAARRLLPVVGSRG
jgi:ribosomal protein S12 methylthiotransferase